MRRKLAALFLACLPAFAVGTIQQSFQQLGLTTTYALAVNWTGDSVNGSVPATLANLGGLTIQGYRIFSVEVAPGTPAPSTNYSLTLTTFLGTDALAGAGSSLSSTLPTTLQAPSTAAPVNGVLTINIAGNSVASAQGRFLVYFTPVFQVMGLPSVNAAGNNTFSGFNIFTGVNTFSGTTTLNQTTIFGPLTSATATPAASGSIRFAAGDFIGWRNNANSADVPLAKNAQDQLTFGGALEIAAPCATSQRTETAADANLLTCAIPAQAGSYRIRFVLSVLAATAATLGWTATWTDSNGIAVAPTNLTVFAQSAAAPAFTFPFGGTGQLYGYVDVDVNNAGTSIVVKLTFSGTSFTAKASATVERII